MNYWSTVWFKIAYYRVNYDNESWTAIAKILQESHSTIHVLNRAQVSINNTDNGHCILYRTQLNVNILSPQKLIDDTLILAQFSYLNYQHALSVALYLKNEIDYIPWKAAFKNFDFILSRSKPNEAFIFKVYNCNC